MTESSESAAGSDQDAGCKEGYTLPCSGGSRGDHCGTQGWLEQHEIAGVCCECCGKSFPQKWQGPKAGTTHVLYFGECARQSDSSPCDVSRKDKKVGWSRPDLTNVGPGAIS